MILFQGLKEKKRREGKRENALARRGEESGEGKGGKYLRKENIWSAKKKKTEKEKKEKKENIWRKKVYFFVEVKKNGE